MRRIDADRLKAEIFKACMDSHFIPTKSLDCDDVTELIDNAPTVEERLKGEWIERVEHRGCYLGVKTVYSYTCPFCGVKEYEKHPFCHCGADMRGDKYGCEEM